MFPPPFAHSRNSHRTSLRQSFRSKPGRPKSDILSSLSLPRRPACASRFFPTLCQELYACVHKSFVKRHENMAHSCSVLTIKKHVTLDEELLGRQGWEKTACETSPAAQHMRTFRILMYSCGQKPACIAPLRTSSHAVTAGRAGDG